MGIINKIIEKPILKKKGSTMFLSNVGMREGDLIFSFTYPDKNLITNYYFNINEGELKVRRASTFDPKKMDY